MTSGALVGRLICGSLPPRAAAGRARVSAVAHPPAHMQIRPSSPELLTCVPSSSPSTLHLPELELAHPHGLRSDLELLVVAHEVKRLSSVGLRWASRRTSTSEVEERMFVKCFSLQGFTSRSSEREFSPMIIPS